MSRKSVLAVTLCVMLALGIAFSAAAPQAQAAGSADYTFNCNALVVSGETDQYAVLVSVVVRGSGVPGTPTASTILTPAGTGLRSFSTVLAIDPALTVPGAGTTTTTEQFIYIAALDNTLNINAPTEEYVSEASICSGAYVVETGELPGPDMVPIPSTAVVGAFVATTPIYFAPQADAATTILMEAGKTAWVYGVDASGGFYKVMLAGKFFWVPVKTMGPNYDAVWNGKPLPTDVVS
jgi:hypothetical protein